MRTKALIWSSLVLVSLANGASATAQAAGSGVDGRAVISAEHQWLKAQQTNDMRLLAPLLADKVIYTSDDKMVVGRDAVIAAFKADTFSSAEYRELRVALFGHVAIATGIFIGKETSAAGKSHDLRLRFTDTWVKVANGRWQCVASQD